MKREVSSSPSKINKELPVSWPARAFRALDTENRGYLFPNELLDHIRVSGTMTN
jgi:hypothetical protein